MDFDTWKTALIREIEIAAEWRAEKVLADPEDPRFGQSQKTLFDLAEKLRSLPADHKPLQGLFKEEGELSNLARATPGEPETRYHEAKEDLLRNYGIEQEPFKDANGFLQALQTRVDETITQYRLR
jgi:hypothetical protein